MLINGSKEMVSEDPGLGWPRQPHPPAPKGNHSPCVLCKGHSLEHNTELDEAGSPRVVRWGGGGGGGSGPRSDAYELQDLKCVACSLWVSVLWSKELGDAAPTSQGC